MRLVVQVFTCLCAFLEAGFCANILGLFPTTAKSAFLASEAIMKGLASRGHNVTVLSCFPQESSIQNYTDISIRHLRKISESNLNMSQHTLPYDLLDLMPIFEDIVDSMGNILESKEISNLLSSNLTFDVVFHEMFVDNVFLMLARKFKAPIIAVGPSYILPWAADRFGVPQNPSYIPVIANGYSSTMSFYERLCNTITLIGSNIAYWRVLVPKSLRVYGKHFREPLEEATRGVSMFFVNTHFSFYGARPYPSQVVEIGGIHVQPSQQLSQELDQWMNKAVFGVIYFSFGSMLRGASLPTEKVEVFLDVFRRIPQQILWKWEDDTVEGMPSNVKIMKWLPQRDILAHPSVKLFISHGGLLGITEAVVSGGVPILGIPTNLDQANNVAAMVDRGAAIYLDYNNITKETLFYSVNTLLTDVSYSRNAKILSRRFLDRPQGPLETAIYWTEYVIRHRGAPHLQSAAVHLTWYQYYLLDVVAACLAVLVAGFSIVLYIIKLCLRLCFKKSLKLKTN